jgi:hypothetical protein
MRILIVLLGVVAGGAAGCVTSGTHTEGDRQVNTQTFGAAEVARSSMEEAQKALPEGSTGWTMLGVGIRAAVDIQKNAQQQEEVHGPPKEPKPYTAENAAAARDLSTKEHAESGLTKILVGAGGIVAGLAGAWFGMPWLAQFFPKLAGKWGVIGQTGIQIVTALRKKSEESGGRIGTKELLAIAKEYNVTAGVQDLVKKEASALEAKLGYTPTVKLEEPAAEPAASPPAPPPVPVGT